MIRAAVLVLLASPALASPLDREAGAPHVYTPDMTLGEAMDLGLVPEPIMEVQGVCPSAWHYRQDWHEFCGRAVETIATEVEWPKGPTPEEIIYGPGPSQPASAFAYLGLGGTPTPSHISSRGFGGVFLGGGSRSSRVREGDRVVTIYEKHVVINKWHKPAPIAPVPLPASVWLLMAGLGMLIGARRWT